MKRSRAKTKQSRTVKAKRSRSRRERFVKASPKDPVSFSVVVTPAAGGTLKEMRRRLSLRTATQYQPNLGELGTMVALQAVKTEVVLKFVDESPFDAKQVSIPQGETRTREVVNTGHFEYTLSCSKCKKKGLRPPQFIVP